MATESNKRFLVYVTQCIVCIQSATTIIDNRRLMLNTTMFTCIIYIFLD